ncbi:DUF927 domain-containing protein [Virgibacillus salarius]|uniref:DUF927 domain-containing protein n=1 Tax=Virgibacillus salarius TaxID=447199 RepID=UPI0024919FCC|nr:DUF927 domain-containing protein [Virgibacillus salarius]WBX81514.1 DUF927 domain-containing protein [Virgibacillus salarius]
MELIFWCFDKWITITVNRGELVKRNLRKLASKGLDVLEDNQVNEVAAFLSKQEKLLKPMNVHNEIGWDYLEGQLVYKHHKIIHKKSTETIESKYSGVYHLEPQGDPYDFFNLFLKEVRGYVPLELMLCIGISPLVIGMLNRSKEGSFDSLLVHIVGPSTTGKTTAAMFGAALVGSPKVDEGLLQTYNGTKNAMASKLAGNHGALMVLDESTMNLMDTQSLSSFIYELAQNSEKSRLSKDSELKNSKTWSTTILSTGESSILKKANNNEGLRVRLFEFSIDKWTQSAESADKLKRGLHHNYGHVVPKVAEKMLEIGPEEIFNMVESNKEYIKELLPDSRFRARVAMKFSVLITAIDLFEITFNLKLSREEILDMLIEQEHQSMDERDMAPKFYVQLKQYITRYRKNFKLPNQDVNNHQEIWGKIEVSENETRCYILPVIFKNIVKELGFSDTEVLISELKKMGVTQYEKAKNKKRKFIFTKEESKQREKVLGNPNYARNGDYTYCIKYDGDIFKDSF